MASDKVRYRRRHRFKEFSRTGEVFIYDPTLHATASQIILSWLKRHQYSKRKAESWK